MADGVQLALPLQPPSFTDLGAFLAAMSAQVRTATTWPVGCLNGSCCNGLHDPAAANTPCRKRCQFTSATEAAHWTAKCAGRGADT